MAPALTAEPLSPKEKLTSSLASPATGTRQSVRKLEPGGATGGGDSSSSSSSSGNISDTAAKKPATVATTTVAITSTNTTTAVGVATRVTRSKDAAQRTNSPSLVQQANNKRKPNNNNNNNIHSSSINIGSEVKPSDDQMGLSAATTHTTSNDGGVSVAAAAATAAASASGNVVAHTVASAPVPAAVAESAAAGDEHNNNCKDNSTAELLANLTSDFEEAITAEICLRKTLPDVSLSKEQPVVAGATEAATAAAAVSNSSSSNLIADPVELITPTPTSESMTEPQTSVGGGGGAGEVAAVAAVIASLTSPAVPPAAAAAAAVAAAQSQCPTLVSKVVEQLSEDASEIHDSIEERLSQLDGSPSVVLPPIVDISPAELEAANAAITAATADVAASSAQQQQLQAQDLQLQQQVVQQQEQQLHTDILATPQAASGASARQSGALLTPQSTASSINFLKDGAAGAVLEDPDIDEVLTALKTLDGNAVQTICDFNFFNEVCFLNNEEEAAAAAAVAAAATGGAAGSAAGAGVGTVTGGAASAAAAAAAAHLLSMSPTKDNCVPTPKQRPWQESHAELELQQQVLARKTDFLLRRMRKFQVRQMCRHSSEEIAGILEWSARTSHKAAPVRSAKLSEQEDTVLSIVSGRPGAGFWEEQTKNPLPASQMSNVLRHIETAARKQQICHNIGGGSASLASSSSWYSNAAQPGKRARKQQQAIIDATTTMSTTGTTTTTTAGATGSSDAIALTRPDEIVPNYDNYVTSELTHVAGLLHTELREVQNAIDSDATESSSGGESADEMVNYNNSQQISLPITRRAVWRYSRDRAAIALRWTYLCTQVADLEMKIRQHNDVYSDLCRTRGDVLLEPTPAPKNGYKEQAATAAGATGMGQQQQPVDLMDDGTPADWLCSRTRPLMLSEFRKRKLFQTINMHTISKKAARPSNIKCGCQWPQVPCTLCTGRPDPTAPRELPETLMPQNRVALLDAGYHPVLSFKDDVCQSIHLEAISRQPDWQYRVMRSQAKAIVKSVWKAERETLAASGGGVGGATGRRVGETGKRRYVRRKERNNNNKSNKSNTANNAAAAPANTSNNNNNNSNINNNNNNNNNNTNNNNKESRLQSGSVSGIVGVDSGNGTGTATTSSSSTPTTTPLVANMAKKQRLSSAKASGNNGSLSSSYPDSGQHNSSLISSNGNGAKKSRKSASSSTQQQQQHHTHNNNNSNHSNSNNMNSSNQQTIGGDAGDSQWETQQQQHSRRNSSETHGHRNDRSLSERRSRLIYDIDNIVIPYSIAAQTRVEILPYKEIPTPKWRIVDSDNEKKQRAAATINNNVEQVEKLNNGCATQAEGAAEEAATAEGATVASEEATTAEAEAVGAAAAVEPQAESGDSKAAAAKGTTAETAAVEEATAAAVTTDKTSATSPTAAATTDAKQLKLQLNNNNNNNCAVKEKGKKVNGLKQQLDKKKAKTDCNAAEAAAPVSNGLPNGKLQSEKEEQQEKSVEPVNEKEQQSQPEQQAPLKLAPPINGKTKKNNNRIPVNHISKESSEKEKQQLKPSEAAAEPPPNKRPKLQLHNKADVAANLPEEAAAGAALPPPAHPVFNEDELEDTSDEAYLVRHQRALIEEKRRFETFLKLSWTNRSRANRRADSRAESSGANTPDPASPAASLHLVGPAGAAGDNESIPSPLAQTMQHPLDAISNEGDVPATTKRQERRRTTSSKLKEHERRSATPDTRELPLEPPPFEELKFPLSEEVYQQMLEEMKTEPRQQMTYVHVHVPSKRTKSKSVSSNGGGDGQGGTATPNAGGSRRSSKTKTNKLATKTTTTRLNGGKNTQRGGAKAAAGGTTKLNGGGKDYYDDGVDYEPEDDDEEEEEDEEDVLLLEEDDDYHHHLAPQDDDKLPPASSKSGNGGMDANLYSASIDAYLGEQEGLDEELLAEEDPFVDDDPNDPEWKRNASGVRHERVRKRV